MSYGLRQKFWTIIAEDMLGAKQMNKKTQAQHFTKRTLTPRRSMKTAASCFGDCFSSAGAGALTRVEGKMNNSKYQNRKASAKKNKKNFTFQHNNDPKAHL